MVPKVTVRPSNSDHLEMRVTHPLDPGRSTEISYHFFIPTALRMKNRWGDRQRVIDNFSVYGRYSSPKITLDMMLEDHTPSNPLWKLTTFLDESEIDETDFCNTLRLFANSLRNAFGRILVEYRKLEKDAVSSGNGSAVMDFIERKTQLANRVQDRWRSLKESYLAMDSVTEGMKCALEWMDEAWCRESGKVVLRISRNMGRFIGTDSDRKAADDLVDFWRDQRKRLMELSKATCLSDEDLVYRQHMLKKWYQSILYLKPIMSKSRDNMAQIAAAVAAAFAMGVAISASFLAESMFLSYTVPWIVITIIAYAFKDRLKEWGRIWLTALLPKVMSDSVFHFNAPSGLQRICQNKIRVRITDSSHVRDDIMEARKWDSNPFIDVLPAEDVVEIEHDITTPRLNMKHSEKHKVMNSLITIISKLNMYDFFKDMDDSESYFFGDFAPGEKFSMENSRKPYHVRLIVQVRNGEEVTTDHYLIKLTKNRIESVSKISEGNPRIV